MESLQCRTYLSPLSQLGLSSFAGAAVSGQDLPPSVRVRREAVTAESTGAENPLQGGSNTKVRKKTVHFNDVQHNIERRPLRLK